MGQLIFLEMGELILLKWVSLIFINTKTAMTLSKLAQSDNCTFQKFLGMPDSFCKS